MLIVKDCVVDVNAFLGLKENEKERNPCCHLAHHYIFILVLLQFLLLLEHQNRKRREREKECVNV